MEVALQKGGPNRPARWPRIFNQMERSKQAKDIPSDDMTSHFPDMRGFRSHQLVVKPELLHPEVGGHDLVPQVHVDQLGQL